METGDLSADKLSGKAASPSRSITSSTIDDGQSPLVPRLLTDDEQVELLVYLEKGLGGTLAAEKCGIPSRNLLWTLARDPVFRQLWRDVLFALGNNVLAALYKAALMGNVTAQIFWLKQQPPLGWGANTLDADHREEKDEVTDEELLELARSLEDAARNSLGPAVPEPSRADVPPRLSAADPDRRRE